MVQCDPDKKVIDYNELIAEKLSKLRISTEQGLTGDDLDEGGFKAGLFAREVAIPDEEEEITEPEITAEEILLNAQNEAELIIENAKKQAETIKQEAYQEACTNGYDEGYKQAMADINKQKEELDMQQRKLVQDYEDQLTQMEPMLVDAITTVVQNVFKVKFEENRNLIVHLLKIALGQIENSNNFIIKVSKTDYSIVLKYKEVLDKVPLKSSNINIVEDITLSKNQCLIETDGGVFDCSLDVQLDNLTKTLKILSLS